MTLTPVAVSWPSGKARRKAKPWPKRRPDGNGGGKPGSSATFQLCRKGCFCPMFTAACAGKPEDDFRRHALQQQRGYGLVNQTEEPTKTGQIGLVIPGEIDNSRFADHMIVRHETPVSGILAVIPVVTHHEIVIFLDCVGQSGLAVDYKSIGCPLYLITLMTFNHISGTRPRFHRLIQVPSLCRGSRRPEDDHGYASHSPTEGKITCGCNPEPSQVAMPRLHGNHFIPAFGFPRGPLRSMFTTKVPRALAAKQHSPPARRTLESFRRMRFTGS